MSSRFARWSSRFVILLTVMQFFGWVLVGLQKRC